MSPTEEEAEGPYRGSTAVQSPCWGARDSRKPPCLWEKKTHPKPQQVAPLARQVASLSFGWGTVSRLPSPLRDTRVPQHPKHSGTASQRQDYKLPFPARPAALPAGALSQKQQALAPAPPVSRDSPPRAGAQRSQRHTAATKAFLHISPPSRTQVSARKEKKEKNYKI